MYQNSSAQISGGKQQQFINAGQAAEFYAAEFGWPVFPCWWITANGKCSCGKDLCKDAGKHPITARKKIKGKPDPKSARWDATTDPLKIRGWFRQYPKANVAIVMGNGRA